MERWRHLEKLAAKAGYTGEAAVERYVGDTTKLGKSKTSLYLASLLARCGERAAAGDAKGAAGTAAGALMFYELLHQYGDLEVAWMMAQHHAGGVQFGPAEELLVDGTDTEREVRRQRATT